MTSHLTGGSQGSRCFPHRGEIGAEAGRRFLGYGYHKECSIYENLLSYAFNDLHTCLNILI